jgi:hypothetical protein
VLRHSSLPPHPNPNFKWSFYVPHPNPNQRNPNQRLVLPLQTLEMTQAPRRVVIFGTSANPPTGHNGHTGIVQHLMELYDEVRTHFACSADGGEEAPGKRVGMCINLQRS